MARHRCLLCHLDCEDRYRGEHLQMPWIAARPITRAWSARHFKAPWDCRRGLGDRGRKYRSIKAMSWSSFSGFLLLLSSCLQRQAGRRTHVRTHARTHARTHTHTHSLTLSLTLSSRSPRPPSTPHIPMLPVFTEHTHTHTSTHAHTHVQT